MRHQLLLTAASARLKAEPASSVKPFTFNLQSGRRGSNPRHQAWKACALPAELLPRSPHPALPLTNRASCQWWGKDSNLRRRMPADLQSAPVGHLGTPPRGPRLRLDPIRADGEDRTRDRPITNRVLYQLSYVGETDVLRELRRIADPDGRVNRASSGWCHRRPRARSPARRARRGPHRPSRSRGALGPRAARRDAPPPTPPAQHRPAPAPG